MRARRRPALAVAVAAALVLIAAPAAAPAAMPDRAAAAEGRALAGAAAARRAVARLSKRRPARIRDRLVGPLAPGLRAPVGGPLAPDVPAPPGTPPPAPLPDYVAATATEFRLALSRPLVGAGDVTIELRNRGEDPHNLVVSLDGSFSSLYTFPEIDPDTYTAASVTLGAGRYQLWCSLLDHRELGMVATLRVE